MKRLKIFNTLFSKYDELSVRSWVKFQTSEKAQVAVGTFLLFYLISIPTWAAGNTTDSFGQLFSLLKTWATGNLGKFIALLGSFISVVIFLFVHRWQILAYGIGGSLLIGGIVGITKFLFEKGGTTFGNTW